MLKKYILVLLLIPVFSIAQFKVEGKITGLFSKSIKFKTYKGSDLKTVGLSQTNEDGRFSFKFLSNYKGMIAIYPEGYQPFYILSDNTNIEIESNVLELPNFKVLKNDLNKSYLKYLEGESFETKLKVLGYLKTLYKSEEQFYSHIDSEIKSLNKKSAFQSDSELLNFIVKHKSKIANNAKIKDSNIAKNRSLELINQINEADVYLETTSIFSEYLMSYINLKQVQYQKIDIFKANIDKDIDAMLDILDLSTKRGQYAILYYLDVFKTSGDQFAFMVDKLVAKTKSLNCKIDEDLQRKVDVLENIKVGKVAPNIEFKSKIKGSLSLYDIKADKKIVMFWASWCPHCKDELPILKQLYPSLKEKGTEVISVSADTESKEWEKYTKNTDWINYCDFKKWEGEPFQNYGIEATPTFIVLDKENKILGIHADMNEVMEAYYK